jgi:SAM-dependent methyltransferase
MAGDVPDGGCSENDGGRRKGPDAVTQPQVSVVIPCYNHGRYLGEAIESVLAQTWANVEIVVIDDGSDDDTAAVAIRYPTVRYVRQRNQGLAAARNKGVRETTGDYLIFLDADDRLSPVAIQAGMDCFRANPECGLVYGAGIGFDESGDFHSVIRPIAPGSDPYEHLLRSNYIWMPHMSIYARHAFEAAGGYDTGVDATADYGLNLKIARLFPIASHETLVAECRYRAGSMSGNFPAMLESMLRVMDKEKVHVSGDAARSRAWRVGARNWKANYCGLTARSVAAQLRSRRPAPTLGRELATLARFGPLTGARMLARELRDALKGRPALRSSYYLWIVMRQMVSDEWRNSSVLDRLFEEHPDPWHSTRQLDRERVSITLALLDAGQRTRFSNALELACAEGIFTAMLAPRCERVYAVDYSTVALARAAERLRDVPGVRFARLDIRHDPIDGKFDLVLAMGVLTYLVRPWEVRRACDKLINALEPGGLLLFSDTRQSRVFETAWWGRLALRGGEQIRRMLSAHPKLILESVADTDTHVFAVLRRRAEG